MSGVKGKVGKFEFAFQSPPRGPSGVTQVQVSGASVTEGRMIDVRWRRDADGIWIELPHGAFGFDISGSLDDDGKTLFQLIRRSAPGAWSGASLLRAGEESTTAAATGGAKKGVRVRAQMPGKILSVSVKAGDLVEKDQTLLVMEAMKMENVIRASQAGKINLLKVVAGQAVETGADLCVIDLV